MTSEVDQCGQIIPLWYYVMYDLRPTVEYEKLLRKWPKKHRRELLAMLHNLSTVHQTLNTGVPPLRLCFGFLHHEPLNIKAVDQKGGGAGLKECRLYFFADEGTKTLHLLTIGDKSSQSEDIDNCKHFVGSLNDD